MTAVNKTLTPDFLNKVDAYWRSANYISVGKKYLAPIH